MNREVSNRPSSTASSWFDRVDCGWGWLLLMLLLILFALSHSFTSFALYDDESYIMMTMQTFFQGHRLYGETYSQYGPAFYFLQTPLHQWLPIPITHDIVRLKTIGCWLVIAWLTGRLVTEVTRNRALGCLGILVAMLHLEKLGLEPAHPQEVIAVASVLALWLFNRQNRSFWLIAGAAAAIAGLTKLNAGAILAMPFLFAAAWPLASKGSRVVSGLGKAVFLICGAGCVSLPTVIGGVLITDFVAGKTDSTGNPINGWDLIWPFVMFVSAMSIVWLAWTNRFALRSNNTNNSRMETTGANSAWLSFSAVLIGGIAMSALITTWVLSQQTSLDELIWGVVRQHTFMPESFYVSVSPTLPEMTVLIVFVLLAGPQVWLKKSNANSYALAAAPLALIIAIGFMVKDGWAPLAHGYEARGASRMLSFIGPLLMPTLLLRRVTTTRLAIAMHGCLGPLLAYPVSGTQLSLGSLAAILGILVVTNDALEIPLANSEASATVDTSRQIGHSLATLAVRWGLPLAVAGLLLSTICFGSRWVTNLPLDQPGCRWVRLEPEVAIHERAVAAAIRNVPGDKLAFDLQNLNRYFFWTERQPLTAINPTIWPKMITPDQRETIRQAFANAGDVCVVRLQGVNDFLEPFVPEISDEMFRDWKLETKVGDWEIGLRPGSGDRE